MKKGVILILADVIHPSRSLVVSGKGILNCQVVSLPLWMDTWVDQDVEKVTHTRSVIYIDKIFFFTDIPGKEKKEASPRLC